MTTPVLLDIETIQRAYATGALTPSRLVMSLVEKIEACPDQAIFITRPPSAALLAEAALLDVQGPQGRALYGIPYAVKDNIDVAGLPTSAACPGFAYMPARDATSTARLRAAGALMLGKTNLDQFATGLNGTRSPYGAPRCVFNADYVSGGSSSGSAVAVAAGLACFALGTDTAGSGRVPAGFNNIAGLKPSIGRIPATGMVPACQSLDCVSIFANTAKDCAIVLHAVQGDDGQDPYGRPARDAVLPTRPRAGILAPGDRLFHDPDYPALYQNALDHATALGWILTPIPYAPFRTLAEALYGGPLAAERLAAIPDFYARHADAIDPVVRAILDKAAGFSAAEAFAEQHRVQALRRQAQAVLDGVDILLLPTAPYHPSLAEMRAEPLEANEKLGLYTNFVNQLDLAGIAVPAGFTPAGLPFGVTLLGSAFSEVALCALAGSLHTAIGAGSGLARA